MTEQTPPPGIDPSGNAAPGFGAAPAPRTKRQPGRPLATLILALMLAALVVAAWLVYMLVAPEPVPAPAASAGPARSTTPPDELHVLAWGNALDPEVLAAFTAESGLKVVVEPFDSNEQMMVAATRGLTQDLVLASGVGIARLVAADLLQTLPANRLANYANLDPAIMSRADTYDQGNLHSVALLWGTTGLAYNATQVAERLGGGVNRDSWALLFDPANAAKLAGCGIQVIDFPTRGFPIALDYLGRAPNSSAAEDTEAAARVWEAVRPHITRFGAEDLIAGLGEGRLCLAVATSGDVFQARAAARAAGGNVDIRYVLPREGSVMWFDLLAIPRAAPRPENSLKLIDYLLRPEVAARLSNGRGFANAVPKSQLYVRPEIKNDPALTPSLETMARLAPEADPGADIIGLRTRFWRLINTPTPK